MTSTITRALSAGGLLSVENLIMLGAGTATGNALNNTLDGSQFAGVNALIGGLGNDTYVLGAGSDTVTEAAGTSGGIDTATSTIARSLSVGASSMSRTSSCSAPATGTGNAAVNTLDGSTVRRRQPAPRHGQATTPTSSAPATPSTRPSPAPGGTDTVRSLVTHTLGLNVEHLVMLGAGIGTGNATGNSIDGSQSGAANQLRGLGGNDTYTIGAGDTVVETIAGAAGGTDTVRSLVSHTLGLNVENLVLISAVNQNGTGNTVANTITGNGFVNVLNGKGGNDTLTGGARRTTSSSSTPRPTARPTAT